MSSMNRDSSRPRNGVVSQSEASDAQVSTRFRSPAIRELPLYVDPLPDEALLSWLLRLARRLNLSMHVLAHEAFGIDDHGGQTHWWSRPNPWLLKRISDRTGVGIERLRRMTLAKWMPVYREDEDSHRFAGPRFVSIAPDYRLRRHAVCAECLEEDAEPYLRLWWMIGWVAVCPRHTTILVTRCAWCRGQVRVARLSGSIPFAPLNCTSCGETLQDGVCWLAHPSVIQLQGMLLEGKRHSATAFPGIGRLSWPETIALIDFLLGAYWRVLDYDEQESIRTQHEESDLAPSLADRAYDTRYGSLQFLAWLLDGWPHSAGARTARHLLARGLDQPANRIFRHLGTDWTKPRSPEANEIDPDIRGRLRELL
jgi:hypothetical protein